MSRSGGGGNNVETGACIFGEFELWLQPAELTDYWCDVYTEVHRLQNRLLSVDSSLCLQMKVLGMPNNNNNNLLSAPSSFGSKKKTIDKISLSKRSSLKICCAFVSQPTAARPFSL